MKKFTVALALVLAMLSAFVLGSCAEPDVKTKVNVKVVVGGVELYSDDVTVKTSADNTEGPTVIDAIKVIMDSTDAKIELDSKGTALARYGAYYETKYKDVTYFWNCIVNEKDASGTDHIKEGDSIVYTFMMMVPDGTDAQGNPKVKTEEYDILNDVFVNELAGNETETPSTNE